MSVPVPKRGHGELDINTKARELTVYTLTILKNQKTFPPDDPHDPSYPYSIRNKLADCVLEIQSLCWEANNIKVDGDENKYRRRMELEERAADKCNRMQMLIETAQPLYHLETRRVRYWISLVLNLRNMIRAWHRSNESRLKPAPET